jgi:hypothetical protein
MRGWERLWTRDDHWLRIEKWKIRQQHTPDWVCLAQIADWCARRPGDIERDHRRRVQAYSDLQQSIMLGEFGEGSRLKVVYLEPQPPSLRDRVRLRLHTGYFRTEKVLDHVLDLCWAPRELCLRWLVARHIDAPPWLAAPRPPADAFEGLELLNLCVWAKTNGGMGTLYRSCHELVFVLKNGPAPYLNNVQLGRFGRNRSNV